MVCFKISHSFLHLVWDLVASGGGRKKEGLINII